MPSARVIFHTVTCDGRELGLALLRDAVLRVIGAAEMISVRALLVHAILDETKAFYKHHGFRPSATDTMT